MSARQRRTPSINGVQPSVILDARPSACIKRPGGQICGRILSIADRRWDRPDMEPDYCGFCALPLTERAKDLRRPGGVQTRDAESSLHLTRRWHE